MELIQKALTKFNYQEAQPRDLAELSGLFNQNELVKIDLYWDPVFNRSWLYLSSEFIFSELIDSKSKSGPSDFITNSLFKSKEFKKDIDYKEIKRNDDLVKKSKSFRSEVPRNKKENRGGNNKKFYAITGKTLKKLLMKSKTKKGADTREYYIKVEELAMLMRDYIQALHQHIFQKQLEEKNKQIEEQKRLLNRAHDINRELTAFKLMKEKNETVYVMSNKSLAEQGLWKIGKTKTKASKRLSSANGSHPISDSLIVLKEIKTHDSKELEHRIHFILKNLRPTTKREFFLCSWEKLIYLLEIISDNMDKEINEVNEIVKSVYNKSNNNWTEGLDMSIFDPPEPEKKTQTLSLTLANGNESQSRTTDVTTLSDDEKKELCKTILEDFIKTNKNIPDYNFQRDKDDLWGSEDDEEEGEPITIVWTNMTGFTRQKLGLPTRRFKKSEWSKLFKSVTGDAQGIKFKQRRC